MTKMMSIGTVWAVQYDDANAHKRGSEHECRPKGPSGNSRICFVLGQ
jgi:hypothetical protein